ncbi:MAG: hypothetical protein DCC55_08470 [Chloroflexi bacterium]|nr:MAG: hypothetical protein DCC55_08470 [Chloroflexota bacterium]
MKALLALGFVMVAGIVGQMPAYATRADARQDADWVSQPANTIISGDITTDTTWTGAGSPYEVTAPVNVLAGVTLTVQPGVMVRFNNSAGLVVRGRLLAVGTAAAPIVFTGVSATPGGWRGIQIIGTADAPLAGSLFDYVTVEYGGLAVSNGANLYLEYAAATIGHSTFRHGGNHGVLGGRQGLAHISDSTFSNNPGYALFFSDATVNPALGSLTATGNGTDAVGLATSFTTDLNGDHVWERTGIPYIVTGLPAIASGATLSVEPGVEVQFMPNTGLTAHGVLRALGAPGQPITFTGTTKTPGSWRGILIQGAAGAFNDGSTLSNVTVEYGGFDLVTGGNGNLFVERAAITVTQSFFQHGGKHGLVGAANAAVQIADSHFTGNPGYALLFQDAATDVGLSGLTATGNGVDAVGLTTGFGANLTGAHRWEAGGLPYIVNGIPTVAAGATLTVDPGMELRFESNSGLTVQGRLLAIGTPAQPISFTGTGMTPGSWRGINFAGTLQAPAAGSILRHVTVAYGGSGSAGGNVTVVNGQVAIEQSILRDGGADGLYAGLNAAGTTVERSQIIGNGGYGIRNIDTRPTRVIVATNNWWGANSGPTVDNECNPGGTGSRASVNVAFSPFLTSPDADPGPVAPGDARLLALTPERWFAPADGLSRVVVKITLRDGTGQALPGRQVRLQSSQGTVVDGGLTDVQGRSFAYVTSTSAGDAELSATLDLQNTCEFARSPLALVTFTPPSDESNLLPDAAAPYLNNQIEAEPLPLVRGVPTVLRARLTNPNPFPITVDATFGVFQLGIGLTFGPVGEVNGVVIPANSERVIQVPWTPVISGHYCIELRYAWQPVPGASAGAAPARAVSQGGGSGRQLRNFNVAPGPLAGPQGKPSLDKAAKATGAVGKLGADKGALFIPKVLAHFLVRWQLKKAGEISQSLGGDPPRQDYRTIALPEKPTIPPFEPDDQLSAARAAAINALIDALLDVQANGDAAVISLDRYGGATVAGDLQWASQQAAALIYYEQQLGAAMITVADRLDAFRQVLQDEGVADVIVTADDLRAYQERLRSEGFSAAEIAAAQMLGWSADAIEADRQASLAADPVAEAGSLMDYLATTAATYREAGDLLRNPVTFGAPAGGAIHGAGAGASNLIRIFEPVNVPIQVANPLAEAATIDLRVRPLDLLPDWSVTVTPATVTLEPGAQTTVTVSIRAGTAAVQGTQPLVAIEGSANGQLIDGVAVAVMLPQEVFFDGRFRLYLPAVAR